MEKTIIEIQDMAGVVNESELLMPTQRSVATRFWVSQSLKGAGPYAKLTMLHLMTAPRANIAGLFKFSWEDCQDETELPREEIAASLKVADVRDFAIYDPQTRWVWVVNRLRFEFPNGEISDKQREGIRRILDDAPKCLLVLKFCEFYKGLGNPFESHYESLSQCLPESLSKGTDPTLYSRLSTLYSRLSNTSVKNSLVEPNPRTKQQIQSPKKEKGEHPIQCILKIHHELFLAQFRGKPHITSKDAAILKRLISSYGEEKVTQYLRAFHASTDPWIKQSGYTIGVFSSCFNKFIASNGQPLAAIPPRSAATVKTGSPSRGPRYQPRQTG